MTNESTSGSIWRNPLRSCRRALTVPDDKLTPEEEASALFWFFRSIRTLWRAVLLPEKSLSAKESASTLFRFFRSKHVADLRLIFVLATIGIAIHVGVVFWISGLPRSGSSLGYIGSGLVLYGAVNAWVYLTAATRLGVVDLFACEISTLCRVGTIVDMAKRYVELHKRSAIDAETAHAAGFVSQEDYFPIFANNSRDLQALEALVVVNITEFYTYMKATRDSQRKLADTKPSQAPLDESKPDPWHAALANMIYMLFLGYESARKSVRDLIEFEPTRAEDTMVILLSELICYAFLCRTFKGDQLKSARLELRRIDYVRDIRELYTKVNAGHGDNDKYWIQAKETAPQLKIRFEEDLRVSIDEPFRDLP
jgi:hypothetical protein